MLMIIAFVEFNNSQSEIGKWPRHGFGLTYLNPEEVSDFFVFDLFAENPSTTTIKVDKYADYLLKICVEEQ